MFRIHWPKGPSIHYFSGMPNIRSLSYLKYTFKKDNGFSTKNSENKRSIPIIDWISFIFQQPQAAHYRKQRLHSSETCVDFVV